MPFCTSCDKFFEADDYLNDDMEDMTVCPDCYYGGGMNEVDDTDFEDDDSEGQYEDDIFTEYMDEEADLDDYENRLDAEEGGYE